MKLSFVLYSIRLLLFVQITFAQQNPQWGIWQTWGDQGDGTYQNPILPGDYSDLDCIRAGADYYIKASQH